MKTLLRCGVRMVMINILCFLFLVMVVAFGVPNHLYAAALVSARYLPITGQEVVFEVSARETPPQSIIVIQIVPVQFSVVKAHPPAKSVNEAKGELKWLINDLKSGTREIRLTLDRTISIEEIHGEIRYRESSGEMVIVPIAKP
ncbi:MAG: hypothetical protein KKD63_16460 [Proteobacteria bacterium]|nr:hypothetical protein [Desulfobulbaceae bacterium]MBU4154464.1 hypothetical protein [Pseudomonadota bacterium]